MEQKLTNKWHKKDLLTALFMFGLAAGYYYTYHEYSLNPVDEGITANAAARILEGQKLYRDFDMAYAPGGFYLLAFFFSVFGENLITLKYMGLLVVSINVSLIYLLARRLMPFWAAVVPMTLIMLVPAQWYKGFFILFPLLNLAVLFVWLDTARRSMLALVGLVTALAYVFRQDAAMYLTVVNLAVIIVRAALTKWPRFYKRAVTDAGIYLLFICVGLLPVIVYFHDTLYDMVYMTVISPLFEGGYIALASAPYPNIIKTVELYGLVDWNTFMAFVFYMPVFLYTMLAIWLLRYAYINGTDRKWLMLLSVFLTGCAFYNKAIWESQYDHLIQAMPLSYLVLGLFGHESAKKARQRGITAVARFYSGACVIFALVFSAVFIYYNLSVLSGQENGSIAARFNMEKKVDSNRSPVYTQFAPNLNLVISRINKYTEKGDYILVFPQTGYLYFTTERKNPTRQDFNIVKFTDEKAQREIIEGLKKHKVKLVIYDEVDKHISYPRPEYLYFRSYAKDAYRYIFDNYSVTEKIGRYRIMLERHRPTQPEGEGKPGG